MADVLDRQREDEREQALRALLARPLLAAPAEELALVRRHAQYLRDWFARETGWALMVERGFARLVKRPASASDATRGEPELDRDRYVLFCLACAALERGDAQVTLRALGERLLEAVADPELAARGFVFTLEPQRERRALVAVCKLLLELGVLARVAGDEEAYVNQSGDALYDVNRRVLAALPASARGASYIEATEAPVDLERRLAALIEEYVPDSVEGARTAVRHRLARRLLDDPVVYHDELTADERDYLANQRGPMALRLARGAGLVPELRAEGTALVDAGGELTDEQLPAVGTEAHVTLLIAEHLAAAERERPGAVLSVVELAAFVAAAADRYGRWWRKTAREPGAEQELAEQAVRRLERLKLVRRTSGGVQSRPALLRYGIREAELVRAVGAPDAPPQKVLL
ncbi:MAG TPA: TIGR02678 family protein [Gammaproteobacteria bacterium]|nr:TIGR02678 family protein [Gammaproteobacteria bacterium]